MYEALINNTFNKYSEYNKELLLIAKYNIMDAMESRMGPSECRENRKKYAQVEDFTRKDIKDNEKELQKQAKYVSLNNRELLFERVKLAKCSFRNKTENISWLNEKIISQTVQNSLLIIGSVFNLIYVLYKLLITLLKSLNYLIMVASY